MMVKILGVAVVLVSFVALTVASPFLFPITTGEPFVDCSEPIHHKMFCSPDSICAYNRCDCPAGNDCRLVCSSSVGDWCNGLHEDEFCVYNHHLPWRCASVKGKKGKGKHESLMCIVNPAALIFSFYGTT